MRQVLKFAAGIAVALVAFAGFSGVAGAQDLDGYEPGPEGCAAFDFDYSAQVQAGGTLEVTNGVSDTPNAEVSLALDDVALGGTLVTDADGAFAGSYSIPADLAPGTYELIATCGGVEYLSEDGAPVEVLAATQTPNNNTGNMNTGNNGGGNGTNTGSTPLARTGFEARPLVTLGAAALVLGGAAVYGSRRRRSSLI